MNTNRTYRQKQIKDSIPSYGLILYYRDITDPKKPPLFLIQQRRDTFEYVESVQGTWNNVDSLKRIGNGFSTEEKMRLTNHTFEEIWDDLWIDKNAKMYKDGFDRAKKKYEHITKIINDPMFQRLQSVQEPPWGFPKGRKNNHSESDKDCAVRETEEETRIPREMYNVLDVRYSENFKGSNGMGYSTVYFLCEVSKPFIPEPIETPTCIRKTSLSEEVQAMKWVEYSEACKYLHERRQIILCEIMNTHFKEYTFKK